MNETKRTENEEKIFELIGKLFDNDSSEWMLITLDTMLNDWYEYTTDGFGKEAIQDMTNYTYKLRWFIENMNTAWGDFKFKRDHPEIELSKPCRIDLNPGLN